MRGFVFHHLAQNRDTVLLLTLSASALLGSSDRVQELLDISNFT